MGLFSREVLGVQLGPTTVSLCQIRLQRAPEVTAFAEAALPVAPEKEHPAGFDPVEVTGIVKELLKNRQHGVFRSRDCYLNIPESKVFRKILELPITLEGEELKAAIHTESASFLPDDPALMTIDFQIIPATAFAKPDATMQALAVVAVEQRVIQEYMDLLGQLKVHVQAIDTRAAALMRALVSPQNHDPIIIVALENETATIALAEQSILWATGSVRITDDASLNATSIADEVEHVVKFYGNRSGKKAMTHSIILTGSESLGPLKKLLQKQVESSVLEGKIVIQAPEGCGLSYAGAVGTALYPLYALL